MPPAIDPGVSPSRGMGGVRLRHGSAGFSTGGATPEPTHEERMHRTLGHTQRAARLFEEDFASVIEENELLVPAAEQLYAAL